MTALDFPNSPTTGQAFGNWTYNGTAWVLSSSLPSNGIVGYAQIIASQASITGTTDIVGLSATWVANPSRTYRTTVQGEMSGTAGDRVSLGVYDGSTQKVRGSMVLAAIGQTISTSVVETGLSGAITRKATVNFITGSGAVTVTALPTSPAYLLVEDITLSGGGGGGAGSYVNLDGTSTMTGKLDLTGIPDSGAGKAIEFDNTYAIYSDNIGSGSTNTRLWIDGPNGGQIYIGPRAGASALHELVMDATTVSVLGSLTENGRRVVESGSNSNGSWIKHSDGTMECWRDWSASGITLEQYSSSPLYFNSLTAIAWTYPVPFVGSPPVVTVGRCRWGSGAGWGTPLGETITQTNIRAFDMFVRASGSVTLSARAIGKWA